MYRFRKVAIFNDYNVLSALTFSVVAYSHILGLFNLILGRLVANSPF